VYDPVRQYLADKNLGFDLKVLASANDIFAAVDETECTIREVTDVYEAIGAELTKSSFVHAGTNVAPCGAVTGGQFKSTFSAILNTAVLLDARTVARARGLATSGPAFDAFKDNHRDLTLFTDSSAAGNAALSALVQANFDELTWSLSQRCCQQSTVTQVSCCCSRCIHV
jgi:hypothetical protein